MDAYDKSVWTQSIVARPGMYFVSHATYTDKPGQTVRIDWLVEHERLGMVNGVAPLYRSILPVPSAEEHAALVECAEKARAMSEYMKHWEEDTLPALNWDKHEKALDAALARLAAARKEQAR